MAQQYKFFIIPIRDIESSEDEINRFLRTHFRGLNPPAKKGKPPEGGWGGEGCFDMCWWWKARN